MKYLIIDKNTLMPYQELEAENDRKANLEFDTIKKINMNELMLLKVVDDGTDGLDSFERKLIEIIRDNITDGDRNRVDILKDHPDFQNNDFFIMLSIDDIDAEAIIRAINNTYKVSIPLDTNACTFNQFKSLVW